ncbi:MAG TPA: metal-dependent hydrolase [Verrucomicrobiae bacterium]|jgi:L-ascorbate metabolism protein UlaG (beta-lactamase superfamily)|nr:metal-dependent hydrolase [Verrucomicrobiae bacterium]
MKVTFYGHACFAVQIKNRTILFDPFITPNELAKSIDVNKVPADYILITHGHDDHLADALAIAKRTGALIVAPYEVSEWLGKQGASKTHPVNPGGVMKLDVCRAKFVNAIHSSSLPDGTYGGSAGGFVVESDEGNFYYAGDTALTLDMKLIGESTRLNWAALPVGDNFTMGAADAVRAAEFVNCNEVLGVHFDTFPPIKIDHRAAIETFAAKGKKLHLLKPGETHDF